MLPTTLPYLSKLTGPRQVGILSLARSAASNAFLSSILPSTLERRFEHGAVGIGRGGVEAGIDLVVAVHTFDEFLFSGLVELRRVPARRDDADGVVAHLLQQCFVDRGQAAGER